LILGAVAIAGLLFLGSTGFLWSGEKTSDEEIIRKFHEIYYRQSSLWSERTQWLGVPCEQTPHDSWVMQEIIYETKPDFVVETGTYKGGSTLYYATVLEKVNKDGRVITVDIENLIVPKAAENPLFKERVDFILGDSVSAPVIDAIKRKVAGRRTLVTLDSLHTKDHVLKELKLYADFVSVGSYLVVQDTNINGHPVRYDFGPGPMEAVTEFLKTDDRFQIDHDREKFMITFYPSGYLKRIK
jgi:cephalosporin hydroxylase